MLYHLHIKKANKKKHRITQNPPPNNTTVAKNLTPVMDVLKLRMCLGNDFEGTNIHCVNNLEPSPNRENQFQHPYLFEKPPRHP